MYDAWVPEYMHVDHEHVGTWGDLSELLKLELQMVVNQQMRASNQTQLLYESSKSPLNHGPISPAPEISDPPILLLPGRLQTG